MNAMVPDNHLSRSGQCPCPAAYFQAWYIIRLNFNYLPDCLYLYNFMFPSTWQECWFKQQHGQSNQVFVCKTSNSYWQYFLSWNALVNVHGLIEPIYMVIIAKKKQNKNKICQKYTALFFIFKATMNILAKWTWL